jgi:hypothetical protein
MTYSDMTVPELIVQHTGQVFPLTQESITIGAAADNAIILADPQVSAYHAVISWQAASHTLAIQDLNSAGGTYVNERRVTRRRSLRQGDAVRLGRTILHVQLEPGGEPYWAAQPEGGPSRSPLLIGLVIVLLTGITMACTVLAALVLLGDKERTPQVVIQSPSMNSHLSAGEEVLLQAAASGASSITLLELSVDNAPVATATSADAEGQSLLTVSRPWTFAAAGVHRISAVAHTAQGKTSETAWITVNVAVMEAEVTPSATPQPSPPSATPLQATSTPTLAPEPSATLPPPTPLPPTASPTPTATPTPEPTRTPEPSPTLAPPPQIEYFQADPSSIARGGCTTLEWGMVSHAVEASIDPGIGPVSAPGSVSVCPANTTRYTLTARGPGGTTSISTLVTIVEPQSDLLVSSILFDPTPAVQDEDNEVKIAIANVGAGAAGAFGWELEAGADGQFSGRLPGLDAGATTVVTVRWKPAGAYDSLNVVASVDTGHEVAESDETNNELRTSVQVLEAAGTARTITLQSEAALDGYRSNDGRGRTKRGILVGNDEPSATVGEVVWRGFLSFDLASLPAGATIESVELRFYQADVEGSPYDKLGRLVLDHVDYGSRLDDSAFDAPFLDSAVLAPQPSPEAWYISSSPLFVEWLEKDLAAGRTRLQLRLQWEQETDGDGEQDLIDVESADNYYETGNVPELRVSYNP